MNSMKLIKTTKNLNRETEVFSFFNFKDEIKPSSNDLTGLFNSKKDKELKTKEEKENSNHLLIKSKSKTALLESQRSKNQKTVNKSFFHPRITEITMKVNSKIKDFNHTSTGFGFSPVKNKTQKTQKSSQNVLSALEEKFYKLSLVENIPELTLINSEFNLLDEENDGLEEISSTIFKQSK